MHVSDEFDASLRELMRGRGFSSKSEAIRAAVAEAVTRLRAGRKATDFRQLIGAALAAPTNPAPRFQNDDDLWEAPRGG
jgi:Arc/MetJ-type ribon-helix-helix transcriptional regulator